MLMVDLLAAKHLLFGKGNSLSKSDWGWTLVFWCVVVSLNMLSDTKGPLKCGASAWTYRRAGGYFDVLQLIFVDIIIRSTTRREAGVRVHD